MPTPNTEQISRFGVIVGKTQRTIAIVAICVLVLSVTYAVIAARSCTGLGCTSSLAAIVVAGFSFALALLLIPAIAWLKAKPWAPVVNLVMLLPLIAAGLSVYAIRHDIAQARQARPLDIGIGTSVVTQDLPVMESIVAYLIDETSAAQPFRLSEKTLDYGHEAHPSKWDDCLSRGGVTLELIKDFRRKAHNSVLLPFGFGKHLGIVAIEPTKVVDESGSLYAFSRPGVSPDTSQALIYVEARAPVDGWGTHYILERADTQWRVVRALCGWTSQQETSRLLSLDMD